MTAEHQDITEDFYSGNKKDIQVTIRRDGSLKDLTNCELTYALILDDVKNPQTLFQKNSVDTTQIEVTGLGVCLIHLLPSDTLNYYGSFRHQLHMQDENGYGDIVMTGAVKIFRAFAVRPRSDSQPVYLSGN